MSGRRSTLHSPAGCSAPVPPCGNDSSTACVRRCPELSFMVPTSSPPAARCAAHSGSSEPELPDAHDLDGGRTGGVVGRLTRADATAGHFGPRQLPASRCALVSTNRQHTSDREPPIIGSLLTICRDE